MDKEKNGVDHLIQSVPSNTDLSLKKTPEEAKQKIESAWNILPPLDFRLDSAGLQNFFGPERVGNLEKRYERERSSSAGLYYLARTAKWMSPNMERDPATVVFEEFDMVMPHMSESLNKRKERFQTAKTYIDFLHSGGDLRAIQNQLPTEREKINFLAEIGAAGKRHYDVDRRNLGAGAPGIVDKNTIVNALQNDVRFISRATAFSDELHLFAHTYKTEDSKWDTRRLKVLNEEIKKTADFLGITQQELLQGKTPEEFANYWDKKPADLQKRLEQYLAQKSPSGVCRDIGVYQAWLADKLGIQDTFSSSANWSGTPHVVSGGRTEKGNFYFLNYGTYYETKAKNFKDALAEYEQYVMGGVAMTYYVSRGKEEGKNLIPVRTKAGEQLIRLAAGRELTLGEQTERAMTLGNIRLNDSLSLAIDRQQVDVRLTQENLLGSTLLQFSSIDNKGDFYNAIQEGLAARLGHQFEFGKDKKYGLEMGAAYFEGKLKTLPIKLRDLFLQLHPHMTDNKKLSESWQLRYAFGMEALVALGLETEQFITSGALDVSGTTQLAYLGKNGEIFWGLQSDNAVVTEDIREAKHPKLYPAHLDLNIGGTYRARKLTLGGKVGTGLLGLGQEGHRTTEELSAILNNQYFLNLNAVQVLPKTFFVTEQNLIQTSVGFKTKHNFVLSLGAYRLQEADHAPEQGLRMDLNLVF